MSKPDFDYDIIADTLECTFLGRERSAVWKTPELYTADYYIELFDAKEVVIRDWSNQLDKAQGICEMWVCYGEYEGRPNRIPAHWRESAGASDE